MKITVEHRSGGENEIILRCETLDEEMLDILAYFKERITKIIAYKNHELFMLMPNDVFYAEAVDGKTFVYTKEDIFETQDSLSGLEGKYYSTGYVRIGKSQIVNLRHIKKLLSLSDRRIEITLNNEEKMIASRHYAQNLKEKLGIIL
ncbi:LytTR family transcriptional regulator DNA-binding domain-containing protein [Lachnospiraceae bacterium OttesenSCG-928-D06]|nr:LytTR family transcriptional regulator DNA-binding domain-containing protein [Lachnospiraceae bacterium OttesenSCG-928-D06]